MFDNNFVVAVRAANSILSEFKNHVYIPFDSEYSVVMKNLHSRTALVKVTIDDTVIIENLVIKPDQKVELERYQSSANKLKFIQRTEAIENHRGIGITDGIIKVEFQFERLTYPGTNVPHMWNSRPTYPGNISPCVQPFINEFSNIRGNLYGAEVQNCSVDNCIKATTVGITVPGSKSDQVFQKVSEIKVDDEKFSINLQLIGKQAEQTVSVPVTVKFKLICETCGTKSEPNCKFCSECGTSLALF